MGRKWGPGPSGTRTARNRWKVRTWTDRKWEFGRHGTLTVKRRRNGRSLERGTRRREQRHRLGGGRAEGDAYSCPEGPAVVSTSGRLHQICTKPPGLAGQAGCPPLPRSLLSPRNVDVRLFRIPTNRPLRANRTLEAVSSILISSTKKALKPLIPGAFLLSLCGVPGSASQRSIWPLLPSETADAPQKL